MGGEGVQWLGQAPFTKEKHVFANLGDGTYEHSGILAIRAAVSAEVNITYKILYNDAVAMTGGQPVEGGASVHDIAWQLYGERVSEIYIVSDDIQKYKSINKPLPQNVNIEHRDKLPTIENKLKETTGTTVIIYDQTCAAEKRRRRKRRLVHDPQKRIFINDDVCEGCGDCSLQSNCVAIEPKETELGRKRQINQSSCNKDYSCLKGFCPSFVTVYGGHIRKTSISKEKLESLAKTLPKTKTATIQNTYDIVVTGIGGTGVMTIGAILGMAAHIEGKGTTVLDQTGLAQKNGAVSTHIKIAKKSEDIHAVRISHAKANLLLGCDNITSASADTLKHLNKQTTHSVINNYYVATANFTLDTQSPSHIKNIEKNLENALNSHKMSSINATWIATKLLGDAIATNMFILGFAIQKGLIPVKLESIEEALKLNGVAIDMNKQALTWGRLMAMDEKIVMDIVNQQIEDDLDIPISKTLDEVIQTRQKLLTDYQNKAYAEQYINILKKIKKIDTKKDKKLTETIAKNLYKTMAYKDEYEVARLYSSSVFKSKLKKQFSGRVKIEFNLAPPIFPFKDALGRPKKYKIGAWLLPIFSGLSKLKFLRGTKFDFFGYSEDRKLERQIRDEYIAMVDFCLEKDYIKNEGIILKLLNLPEKIKGFGPIKHRNFIEVKKEERLLLEALQKPQKIAVKIQ
jgi:indolepyruvate ferredoxin oxidoreductase